MLRTLLCALVAACMAAVGTGCAQLSSLSEAGAGDGTIVTDSREIEDGRTVDGYADGRLGDTLTNEFFAYSVNTAELATEYEGMAPEEGSVFLVAECTVKNVFGEPIPMLSSDFQVQWGDGDEDYGYPIPKASDGQMEDEYELARGESVTKTVVYEVPVPEGKTEYSISYLEIYDDDTEGNVFFIFFDLEMPQ